MSPSMSTRILAQTGDTSFINDIRPWLPDFLSSRLTDVAGVALAIGIIVAVIGGVMVFAGIAFARQDGPGDQATGSLMWCGGGGVVSGGIVPSIVMSLG